ncbi:MAG: HAD hydrolase-like protein [Clostridia bacterium]|nr:HAD hydrolase-like protein [Clostridia bacterium]
MITEFIWDFDGMLFNTYPHTTAALCEYYKRHGKEIDSVEAFNKLKISIREAFKFFGMTEDGEKEFYEIEDDLDFKPRGVPYEGIPEILRYIKEHGGRNYLYTHRDKVAIQYLDKFSLTEYFTDFVTREMDFPFKPSPDAVEYLIKKHDLNKENCIMLGDRTIDCGSGLNAGIKALLFDEFRTLKDSSYTYYATTVNEVMAVIKNLMQ